MTKKNPGGNGRDGQNGLINKGGKRQNSIRSEEQVAQVVKNSAKLVTTNEENDESSTVDNDIQFKIPPAELEPLTNPTYKVQIGIGLTRRYCIRMCLVDTWARTNLINEVYLKRQWTCRFEPLESTKLERQQKRRSKFRV